MPEKVSLITPTYRREHFLRLAHRTVAAQTYPDIEWLVLDDSPAPSEYMRGLADPRIHYRHIPQRMKLGAKRNELVAAATGDVIVHFDDDDYYAPHYVERMLGRLRRGHDFVKLSGWYLYAVPYEKAGYWDLARKVGRHYIWSPPQPIATHTFTAANNAHLKDHELAYGFSYVYRKEVWKKHPFANEVHGGEDQPFALAARESFAVAHFRDVRGICLHVLHTANSSRCFPQYAVPSWLLRALFPSAVAEYLGP